MTTAADLIELRERRANYVAAELKILKTGQTYVIDNRSLGRGDLKFIATQIEKLGNEIKDLEGGAGVVVQAVIPLDY